MARAKPAPVTVQDIEQALTIAAYAVVTYGDVYAPLLERLERELEARQTKETPGDRARRILEARTIEITGPVR